jgi:cell division protein FtsZ
MKEEMRVTVVATGLGEGNVAKLPKPDKHETAAVHLVNSDIVEPAAPETYRELDRPTVLRNGASSRPSKDPATDGNLDYLDIPAFLRRQAD